MSAAGNRGERRKGRRFRKPEFRGPPADDAGIVPEDGNLPAVSPSRMAEELGMAMAPLKDLAEAFRLNSDAMKSLAEGQARLGRRIEKSDRSEAVVQSTKALNDTFRGVQRTQERLMGRLEDEKKRPLRLLIASAVVFVVLVGGSLYLLFTWLEERDRKAGQDKRETIESIVAGHADLMEDLRAKLTRAESELVRRETAAESAATNLSDLARRLTEAEKQNIGLRANQKELSREVMQNTELRTTISRLTGELEQKSRDLEAERLSRAVFEEQIASLEEKLSKMARRAAATPAANPVAKIPDETGPEPAAEPEAPPPAPVPEGAATDAGELKRIVGVLNRLIAEVRGEESFTFTKIGGVRGKTLYDVEVANFDKTGAEIKRIRAGEARIVVDVSGRRVELRFKNGHIYYYGVRAPFWGGGYIVSMVNVNPATWLGSGLTIFDELR